MRAINKAWDTLRNPDTRAAYDESQGFDLLREPEVDPAADAAWSPYDEDDDDPMPAEDIAAPGTGKSQPGWLAVAPMALFGAAAFIFVVGAILSLLPLLFLAAVCFLAAIGLFLLLPVVAMSKSRSADRG